MFRTKTWEQTSINSFDLGCGFAEESHQRSSWVTVSGSEQELLVPQILDHWSQGNSLLMLSQIPRGDWVEKVEQAIAQEFRRGLHVAVTTSGSSGEPKVVVHEVSRLFEAARAIIDELKIEAGSVLNYFHPLYTAGILNNLVVAMELKADLVMMGNFNFQSPGRLATWLDRSTEEFNIWLSPKMSQVLLTVLRNNAALRQKLPGRLLSAISATGPLAQKTQIEFEALTGKRLNNTFGTTEHLFIAAELDEASQGSLRLLKDVKGRLNSSEMVDEEEVGILEISTPYQAKMVFESEQGTIRVLSADNGDPSPTGDLASLNDRKLTLHGRTDSLWVESGLNVSLELLQRTVCEVEGVSDCFASGSNGRLFLVVESALKEDQLEKLVRFTIDQKLPTEYQPRVLKVLEALPRTFSGKVDRQKILISGSWEGPR